MKNRSRNRFLFIIIAAAILAAACFGLLKLRSMYSNLLNKVENNTWLLMDKVYDTGIKQTDTIKRYINRYDPYDFDYSWAEQNKYIAHAFGEIDGIEYTNSKEAFLSSYAKGLRVFEVDFELTEEEFYLVAQHDEEEWRELTNADKTIKFSKDTYLSQPLCGKYTPLDYQNVLDLMAEYPDICIVTDTKYSDKDAIALEFSQLIYYAESKYPEIKENLMSRIIPQVYNENMFWQIMEMYPFSSVILTLYQMEEYTDDSIIDLCKRTGINMITIHYRGLTPETASVWNKAGINIAVHTINDRPTAEAYLKDYGVSSIYTDSLS